MALVARAAYGARPVSMDLARGRTITEVRPCTADGSYPRPTAVRLEDQLALAHWPAGHRVVVCGLDGGTGRSTAAYLLAATLAGLPYAHVHKPVALVELRPRLLSGTRTRWSTGFPGSPLTESPAGYWTSALRPTGVVLPSSVSNGPRDSDYSVVVLEAPAGVPTEHDVVAQDSTSSVLLVVRPDRRSLAQAADALVWMHDHGGVQRNRVVVVVNLGAGKVDHGSRAASTALAIRCSAIHRLPADLTLGPSAPLPSRIDLARRLRQTADRFCLDVWRTSQDRTTPNTTRPVEVS